jgi:hypothetical protein
MDQALTNYFTRLYPGQLRPGYTSSGKFVLFFSQPSREWDDPIYSGFIIDAGNKRLLELINLPTDQILKTPEWVYYQFGNVEDFRKALRFGLHYQIHRKESEITWI